MPPRLYLRLGDRVHHADHEEWGEGAVVEEMTSVLEGGTCLVRVMFADGRQRTFHNDLESDLCCYFFGVRKQWRGAAGALFEREAPGSGSGRPQGSVRGMRSLASVRCVSGLTQGTPSAHGCGMPCSSASS